MSFEKWWHETGSGVLVTPGDDHEGHAKKLAAQAWRAALIDHIPDLEAKLAKSNQELSELRTLHRQMVNDAQGLGKKLIEDTCG